MGIRVKDRVAARDFHQNLAREQAKDLPADRGIHTSIVARMQQAAPGDAVSQPFQLGIREPDIAMSGYVQVRVVAEVRIQRANLCGPALDSYLRPVRY